MLLVSDIHFGPLLPVGTEDVILQSALEDDDKLVLFSGDITQSSTADEYKRAEAFIKLLLDNNIVICITPGNHDFGMWKSETFHKITDGYANARNLLTELFAPILRQQHVVIHNEEEHDSVVRSNSIIVFCMRSQHRKCPRIKKQQLEWAERVIAEIPDREDCQLFWMSHHSLWQDHSDHHVPMAKRTRVEEFLKKYNFYAFIHGHNHRFTYQNTTTPNLQYRIRRIGVPSACERNRKFERGYVSWYPPNEPTLVLLDNKAP